MTVVSMGEQEFSRLRTLLEVQSGRVRIADAPPSRLVPRAKAASSSVRLAMDFEPG